MKKKIKKIKNVLKRTFTILEKVELKKSREEDNDFIIATINDSDILNKLGDYFGSKRVSFSGAILKNNKTLIKQHYFNGSTREEMIEKGVSKTDAYLLYTDYEQETIDKYTAGKTRTDMEQLGMPELESFRIYSIYLKNKIID